MVEKINLNFLEQNMNSESDIVKKLREHLASLTQEEFDRQWSEITKLGLESPHINEFSEWDVTLEDGLENEPYVSDDFQIGPDGAYEHSDREINFKEMLTVVSSKLKVVTYTTGDLSDLGNEIGIAVGNHIKGMTASEISQFISGFRHGVSLTNNTH